MSIKKMILPLVAILAIQPSLVGAAQQNKGDADFSKNTLSELQFGPYAVGTKIIFARDDSQRFDPWNTAYASDKYRQLLQEVEKSGQPRTVATSIWYPAKALNERVNINNRLRTPLKSISGQQAKISDYVLNDPMLYPLIVSILSENLNAIINKNGVSLASLQKKGDNDAYKKFISEFVSQDRGAFLNAPIADGKFPVVIISHGLGGNFAMWDRAGEFLASQGYIVAAPTFISDGSTPIVFHDPASEFAKTHNKKEIEKAYQTLAEMKVIPKFFDFLFGIKNLSKEAFMNFDPSKQQIQTGGPEKMVDMQRNLFRQRVSDVNTVKQTLEILNKDKASCLAFATGSVGKACGIFENHINTAKVGLSGHSLGSMTSQLGLEHIPGITTAIGLNNGVPYSWSPQEMFGNAKTKAGLPIGNKKPLLQLVGNEDAFVQSIFYTISQQAIEMGKDDPSSIMQLETERAIITKTNPQPVALSAYERAIGDKMLVTVNDVDHGILAQHQAGFNFPKYMQENDKLNFRFVPNRNRKATGNDLTSARFIGEEFSLSDWEKNSNGQWYYKPHVIRDYYYLNWFNYYLKDQSSARQALIETPFTNTSSTRTNMY